MTSLAASNGSAIRAASSKSRSSRLIHGHPPSFQGTLDDAVSELRPVLPMYVTRPDELAADASRFVNLFPGDVLYAVKCNPEKHVLQTLAKSGVRNFDVASIEEIKAIKRVAPKAKLFYMHPVKSPEAIRAAYFEYGVRAFVLDSKDELYKIMRETNLASDLELFVRLALPKNKKAMIDFSSKFGALPSDAAELLELSRSVSVKLGLCLHVGTQTTDPAIYKRAIKVAATVIKASNVKVDVLDVGGGFPVEYPDQKVPDLSVFMDAIKEGIQQNKLSHMHLMCEPGRALVARSGSLIVRVEGRKGDMLFINDGTYGGLFDAGAQLRGRFPVRRVGGTDMFEMEKAELKGFRFAGPTCDSIDMMDGPFYLPEDIKAGDWIEIGQTGAYSIAMRTNFNGFGHADQLLLLK